MNQQAISGGLQSAIGGGVKTINHAIVNAIPFHNWPYWHIVLWTALGVIVLLIILWFWANFWR